MSNDNNPKYAICKICGKNYQRIIGKFKKCCSQECREKSSKKLAKCVPSCSLTTMFTRDVKFVDGSWHIQQYCESCLVTTYLSKSSDQITAVKEKIKKQSKDRINRYGDSFYSSQKWLALRYQVFSKYGKKCQCCGSKEGVMHIDHIKPRSKYRSLELDINNLQVLCNDCNIGKSNLDETDWRTD